MLVAEGKEFADQPLAEPEARGSPWLDVVLAQCCSRVTLLSDGMGMHKCLSAQHPFQPSSPRLPQLPSLCRSYIACLPPAGPSPVLRSIRILEIDMAIQSQYCTASNACR